MPKRSPLHITLRILTPILLIGGLLFGGIWLYLESLHPPDDPPLPDPNGFDRIVELGDLEPASRFRKLHRKWGDLELQLTGEGESPLDPGVFLQEREELFRSLRAALEESKEWFESLDASLELEARVPISYDPDPDLLATAKILAPRHCALALEARWLHEVTEKNIPAALESALDLFRLSRSPGVGGLIIHRLVGLAFFRMGLHRLRPLLPHLERAQLEEARRVLEENLEELRRDDEAEKAIQRDAHWAKRTASTREILVEVLWERQLADSYRRMRREELHFLTEARLVQLELAIFRFRLDQGQDLESRAVLVPDYLPEVPADPFGEGSLRMLREGGRLVLYSVGPDGRDDGGKVPENEESDFERVIQLLPVRLDEIDGEPPEPHDLVLPPTPPLPDLMPR